MAVLVATLLAQADGFPKRRRKRPVKRLGADEAASEVLDGNAIGGGDGDDDGGSGTERAL